MREQLGAISPIDGRYKEKTKSLSAFFSEQALIRARAEIEVRYLIKLSDKGIIRKFTKAEKSELESLYANFSDEDGIAVKNIESTTRHDVKAVEYWMKKKLENSSLKDVLEFIHFALTSEDVNNLSYGILVNRSIVSVMAPSLKQLIEKLLEIAAREKGTVMLARTHGQPAVPTTFGKEIAVFAIRLKEQYLELKNMKSKGKLNGAVGNYNAHSFAIPNVDWISFSREFIESLGLEPNLFTTQIESHDRLSELLDLLKRINSIIIGLDRDFWSYISSDYLILKAVKGEVGSSTMPQKVNPIDFENSEGNAKVANSLLEGLSRELQISRLQRDLSDSTVARNLGVMFSHCLLASIMCQVGLDKVAINKDKMSHELENHYEILSEGFQTLLRFKGDPAPYEKLKELVRGKKIGKKDLDAFVKKLKVDGKTKQRLAGLTPLNYIGKAQLITEMAINECRRAL